MALPGASPSMARGSSAPGSSPPPSIFRLQEGTAEISWRPQPTYSEWSKWPSLKIYIVVFCSSTEYLMRTDLEKPLERWRGSGKAGPLALSPAGARGGGSAGAGFLSTSHWAHMGMETIMQY